jgi:hypothetical protein
MSLNNNTTDLSGMDFQVDTASNANEMATTIQASNSENLDSKGMLYEILDMDEILISDDTEVSDPEFPEQIIMKKRKFPRNGRKDMLMKYF